MLMSELGPPATTAHQRPHQTTTTTVPTVLNQYVLQIVKLCLKARAVQNSEFMQMAMEYLLDMSWANEHGMEWIGWLALLENGNLIFWSSSTAVGH